MKKAINVANVESPRLYFGAKQFEMFSEMMGM